MWRRRPLAALVLALALASAGAPPLRAEPFVPRDDAEVLERTSSRPADPAIRRLAELRRDLARQPRNLALASKVAWMSIEQGRSLSDPRFYGWAQAALAPWWSSPAPPAPVLVLRATIRQHDHDFAAAAADLAAAVVADPYDPRAWLTRAVVATVTGDYAEARRSCGEVLQLAPPLVAATCRAGVDSLNGSAEAGDRMLSGALLQARDAPAQARLWALTSLAEIAARRGDATAAEARFRAAIGLERADDYLLGAYADFLLEQNRPAEVVALLGDATRADALLVRAILAEKQLGSPQLAAHAQMLGERFAAARLRGDDVHRREEARFALHVRGDAEAALALACDNFQVQREPADVRLLLEAALAAGRPQAAQSALDFVAQTRLEDVVVDRLVKQLTIAKEPG